MGNVAKMVTVALVLCLVVVSTMAEESEKSRQRRGSNYPEEAGLFQEANGQGGYGEGDFLNTLLNRPSKRQWCRKGMTYNHVLGSCMPSLAALRARGRIY